MIAKQRYYNTTAAGSFSAYDEKVLGEMTLYGLPMIKVEFPGAASKARADRDAPVVDLADAQALPNGLVIEPLELSFDYTRHDTPDGTYFQVNGSNEMFTPGYRPANPLASYNIHQPGQIVHGALLTGGEFDEQVIDPYITRIISQTLGSTPEGSLPDGAWFPAFPAIVNRFATRNNVFERLVVTPGQFQALGLDEPLTGTQRLYSSLSFDLYYNDNTNPDFTSPVIWSVSAVGSGPLALRGNQPNAQSQTFFQVEVKDAPENLQRVVVLYRSTLDASWSLLDLAYNPASGFWEASAPLAPRYIEYFAQAVDQAGNVALALDYGKPFIIPWKMYLGLVVH